MVNCLWLSSLVAFHRRTITEQNPAAAYTTSRRCLLDAQITAGHFKQLWIPAHVNRNHRTIIHINLIQHRVSYANSLDDANELLQPIIWWLRYCVPDAIFTVSVPPVLVARQTDGSSCGTVVLSTMLRWILGPGYTPWAQADADLHRILWFLDCLVALMTSCDSCYVLHERVLTPSCDRMKTKKTMMAGLLWMASALILQQNPLPHCLLQIITSLRIYLVRPVSILI